MAKFYRIEDDRRIGPYSGTYKSGRPSIMRYLSDKLVDVFGADYDDYMEKHPDPSRDSLELSHVWRMLVDTGRSYMYVFGFESIEKAENWFCLEGERQYIKEFGLRLSVYEVDEEFVHFGKWQAIAHKKHMKLIESLDFAS